MNPPRRLLGISHQHDVSAQADVGRRLRAQFSALYIEQ
ncbi:hypothetical protein J2X90_005951 [Variovorax paradoxus]|nr:hypothetical protein [Variovorax paradoxus]